MKQRTKNCNRGNALEWSIEKYFIPTCFNNHRYIFMYVISAEMSWNCVTPPCNKPKRKPLC